MSRSDLPAVEPANRLVVADSAATPAGAPAPGGSWRSSLHPAVLRDYAIVAAFVALFVSLALASDNFLTKSNLLNLVDQSAALGIIACAGTLVIVAGGFDLSTAAVYAITGVIAAKAATATDSVVLGYAAGVGAGLAIGILNGICVTFLRVNSFIATLASGLIIAGLATLLTRGELIIVEVPGFDGLGTGKFLGLTWLTWVFIAVALILGFALARTSFGRYVTAVGGNAEAARLAGVRIGAIRAMTFALSGLAAGIAGVMATSRNITGQADSGAGLELTAIAAIVLGGTSIAGGQGAVWRTVLGVLMLGMIANGFNLMNIDPIYQAILQGAIILAAVALDALGRRRAV